MLDNVTEWCKTWKIKINMGKTTIMEIRKKAIERNLAKFTVANKPKQKCSIYRYLGTTFDEFMDFDANSLDKSTSGQRAEGAFIRKFTKLDNKGYDTYTKCYNMSNY